MIAAALCIAVGAARFALPVPSFTLRWQHTIEKIQWEEDYDVVGAWLHLNRARVRGSGAGMEPPDGAVKVGAAWEYRPAERWRNALTLARSEFGADYELCAAGDCRSLSAWAPAPLAVTTLTACTDAGLR